MPANKIETPRIEFSPGDFVRMKRPPTGQFDVANRSYGVISYITIFIEASAPDTYLARVVYNVCWCNDDGSPMGSQDRAHCSSELEHISPE